MMKMISSLPVAAAVLILFLAGCTTPSILVTQEQQKGDYFNNRYEYDQAVIHYENMLEASVKLGVYRNLDMEADVCRKIANACAVQGEFSRALTFLEKALELDSIQGNSVEIIEDYREIGKVHLFMGDFSRGKQLLHRALTLNEGMAGSIKGVNRISIADTYLTLSRLSAVLGDYGQGEAYALSALKIFNDLDYSEGIMEGLLQLGRVFIQLGSGETGEQYVSNSMEMARELGLNTYRHKEALARLNENRALYEEALRYKLEAIDESRAANNLPQIIWAHMLAGDLYAVIGDREGARSYYQLAMAYLDSSHIRATALDASLNLREGDIDKAYAYFSEAGSEVAAGAAGMRLGEVALEWNLQPEALEHFRTSLAHFSNAGLADGMARSRMMIGLTAIRMDSLQLARSNLDLAGSNVQYDETRWRFHYVKGILFEAMAMPDSAISQYQASVQIIEKIRGNLTVEEFKSTYLDDRIDVYDRLIRLLMERGQFTEAFLFSERARARAFLDMMGNNRIHLSKNEGSELVDLEQNLRQEIQSLSRLLQKGDMQVTRGMNRQQVENEIKETREEYNALVQRIKLFHPEYGSIVNVETAGTQEILEMIDPGTAFLDYWVGENELYIWMLSSDGIKSRTVPIGEDEIIGLVMKCRETVGSRRHIGWFTELYNHLIKPFEKDLERFETIGVVPHLPLHFLPFQCLMPGGDTYLIDRFNIFYVPSLNVYSLARKKRSAPGEEFAAFALGGLELGNLPGLPGTTREVSTISTLFSEPQVAYEEQSTETLFKSVVDPFQYVHVATHGILDPGQPMFSYLVMAPSEEDDGMLTVREIFGLNMNAMMVVLSACETALGSQSVGDEIIGLSRAFLFAGSSNVIVSLWSIADEPTAYLMTRFYVHLDEDRSLLESLRMAQIESKEKYGIPSYWAPFQLIGSAR